MRFKPFTNSLRGRHTYTDKDICTETILENKTRAWCVPMFLSYCDELSTLSCRNKDCDMQLSMSCSSLVLLTFTRLHNLIVNPCSQQLHVAFSQWCTERELFSH